MTRDTVLEVAGKIIAERGFANATGIHICEAAGVGNAVLNYYFGGRRQLYEAVLEEAQRRVMAVENWNAILSAKDAPEKRLHAFFKRILQLAARSDAAWCFTIYLRERAYPALFCSGVRLLPTADKVQTLIHEITGLPVGSLRLRRATVLALLPCIGLIACPEPSRSLFLANQTGGEAVVVEEMLAYALGGLQALLPSRCLL